MSEPDANGWMPIETAPKDGTYILGVPGGEYMEGVPWLPSVIHWEPLADDWSTGPIDEEDDRPKGWEGMPFEHWQPLPKPPVSNSLPLTPEASTPAAITPPSVAAGTNSEAQP